jgi:hypothetical protein
MTKMKTTTLTMAAAAVVAVAATLLAGCGTVGTSGGGSTAQAGVTCVLGATGADVQVTWTGSTDCGSDITALAVDGQNWQVVTTPLAAGAPGPADQETLSQVCSLTTGGEVMTVLDAGGAIYGTNICSSEEQNGWTPAAAPASAPAAATSTSALPDGVWTGSPGTYDVNCSVAQCTTLPGAGPFGTTCAEPMTDATATADLRAGWQSCS